jgi:hypothetical protein
MSSDSLNERVDMDDDEENDTPASLINKAPKK